ncbi:MAG: hypothetical protein M3R24_24060 [Chloroflexota bacterium]|nr:hypothetical protein [Chloroflexota bacterium]
MSAFDLGKWVLICMVSVVVGAALGAVLIGGVLGGLLGTVAGPLIGTALARVASRGSPPAGWQHRAQRLTRSSLLLLVIVTLYGFAAGLFVAFLSRPGFAWDNLLIQLQDAGYFLVLILSLPSLFVGAWYVLRRKWWEAGMWLFPFVGPLLVFFVGQGLTPHLDGRLHQLVHTVVGTLPLTVVYALALRKWHPSVIERPQT